MPKIAIFDSGIGGLTFLKQARARLTQADFIYYADTDNVPYGTKSLEQVRELVLKAAEFLSNQQIDVLVLACNTATSAAATELRHIYPFPVLGMEPAVKPALGAAGPRKVLLFSTSLTMRLGKLKKLIEELHGSEQVETMAFDELVRAAENRDFASNAVRELIADKLKNYDLSQFGAVVLGCTHFIYFRDLFEAILPPHILVLDGNLGTLNNLEHTLAPLDLNATSGRLSFYCSARPADAATTASFLELLS